MFAGGHLRQPAGFPDLPCVWILQIEMLQGHANMASTMGDLDLVIQRKG